MKNWKVTYKMMGGRVLNSDIVKASSAEDAESMVLKRFRGNDYFGGIVSVEKVG